MWSRHSRQIEPISLSMSVLPGCAPGCRVIPDAHRCHPPPDKLAVASITIANEMSRHLVPREGLGDLLRNPLYRWVVCHAERDQASPLMPRITNTDSSRQLIVGAMRKSMAPIPAA